MPFEATRSNPIHFRAPVCFIQLETPLIKLDSTQPNPTQPKSARSEKAAAAAAEVGEARVLAAKHLLDQAVAAKVERASLRQEFSTKIGSYDEQTSLQVGCWSSLLLLHVINRPDACTFHLFSFRPVR